MLSTLRCAPSTLPHALSRLWCAPARSHRALLHSSSGRNETCTPCVWWMGDRAKTCALVRARCAWDRIWPERAATQVWVYLGPNLRQTPGRTSILGRMRHVFSLEHRLNDCYIPYIQDTITISTVCSSARQWSEWLCRQASWSSVREPSQ